MERHAEHSMKGGWSRRSVCELSAGRYIQSFPTLQVPEQAIGLEGSGVGGSCNSMRPSLFPMFLFLPFYPLRALSFFVSLVGRQQHVRSHSNTIAIAHSNGRYL